MLVHVRDSKPQRYGVTRTQGHRGTVTQMGKVATTQRQKDIRTQKHRYGGIKTQKSTERQEIFPQLVPCMIDC